MLPGSNLRQKPLISERGAVLKNSVSRSKLRNYVLPEIPRIEYDSLGPERPIEDGNSTPTCSKVRCSVSNYGERESCITVIELAGYLCLPPHLVFTSIAVLTT